MKARIRPVGHPVTMFNRVAMDVIDVFSKVKVVAYIWCSQTRRCHNPNSRRLRRDEVRSVVIK